MIRAAGRNARYTIPEAVSCRAVKGRLKGLPTGRPGTEKPPGHDPIIFETGSQHGGLEGREGTCLGARRA